MDTDLTEEGQERGWRLEVVVRLPQALTLPEGDYQASQTGELLRIVQSAAEEGFMPSTLARFGLDLDGLAEEEELLRRAGRLSLQLVRHLNRLVRWYRVVSNSPAISEFTQSQLSPFWVCLRDDRGVETLVAPITVSPAAGLREVPLDASQVRRMAEGLSSGEEPPVPALFLQDAEYAITQGRFREAILFAWATIDSQFSQVYDQLVRRKLAGDYAEGRKQLLGLDIGLRTKMTAVLNLLTGQSLYLEGREGGWDELAQSYRQRNGIIHRGEIAEQADAERAVRAAHWVMGRISAIAMAEGLAPIGGDDTGGEGETE